MGRGALRGLRVTEPVAAAGAGLSVRDGAERAGGPGGDRPDRTHPGSRVPAHRAVPIRTARDAVTAAVLYLRGLGHRDVRRADQRPLSGIGLAAPGIVVQVDPTVGPASVRDVECLWLTAMAESARGVYFSLAGYAEDARARADLLDVPLFVLDPSGVPRPVNAPAVALDATAG